MRHPPARRLVHLLALTLLTTSPAFADLWYEHYQKGEQALNAQKWEEAAQQLVQAIEKKRDPGTGVRTYGMNFINYHPYLKLGVAYFNMGRIIDALGAFDTEESYAEIKKSPADLKNLQTFRKLAQEARQKGQDTERERIAAIVDKSLNDARLLEQKGQLDAGMSALAQGLAADPNNAELVATMGRLRERAATEEKTRDTQARVAKALREGENLIAAGRYGEASSLLNQALALRPQDAELKRLLTDSQSKLRDQIEAQRSAEEQRTIVRDGLLEVGDLEGKGEFADALTKLSSVLAVDPQNHEALAFQARLNKLIADAGSQKSKEEWVARTLGDAVNLLKEGRFAESVAGLNKVIALDPANRAASGYLAQAYGGINQSMEALRSGQVVLPKVEPVIAITNVASPGADQVPEERISIPRFTLQGTITSDQPQLSIVFQQGEVLVSELKDLTPKPVANLYQFRFLQRFDLPPGLTELTVKALDPRGLTSEEVHRVRYVRPMLRAPWFYSSLGAAAAGLAGGLQAFRVRRRNKLRRRRFNPYVAGAPVLKDDLFLGREALLSRILQTVHNNSILLYGERRIGKTSLQHHLKRRLEQVKDDEYDFYPVYVDLQGTPQERFFATLAEDIFSSLSAQLDGALPGRGLTAGESYAYETFVRDVRDVLKVLRQRSSKKVKLVLLIDEVDELNTYDPRVNQKLRSLFMKSFAEDLVAVVSGVGIKKQWASEGSPWYNFFEEIEVKAFTRADAEELIERPIRGIFKLDKNAVDRIIESTDCKPYLIQRVCIALVNRMYDEKRRCITVADVEAVGRPSEG